MPKRRSLRAQQKAAQRKKKRGQKLSSYARKRQYLNKNGGFGFEYSEPKPWK